MNSKKIILDLPSDFIVMCELTGSHPEHALQYFIDRVSFPKLLSLYPISPYVNMTRLVFKHARRNLTKKVIYELYNRFSIDYDSGFVEVLNNEKVHEQPELEEKARDLLIRQRLEIRKLLPKLILEGYKIKLINYDN